MYVTPVSSSGTRRRNTARNERPVPAIRRKSVDASRTKVQVSKPAVVIENSSKLDNNDSGAGTSANASIESIILASSANVPHVDNRDSDNESSGTVNLAMPSVNLEKLVTVTPAIEQSLAETVDDKHFSDESDAIPLVSSREAIEKKLVDCGIPQNVDSEIYSEVVVVVEGIQLLLEDNNGLLGSVTVEKKSEIEGDMVTTEDTLPPEDPINRGDKHDDKEAGYPQLDKGKVGEAFDKEMVVEKPVNGIAKDANDSVQVQDQRPYRNQLKQQIESASSGILENVEICDQPEIQEERPLNAFISRLGNNSSPNLEKITEPTSGKPASPELLHHSDSTPTLKPLKGGAVLGLTEKLEQERLSRRQRLAEIMMKNRDSNAHTTPVLAAPVNPMEGMDRIRELLDRRAKSNASMNNSQQNTPLNEGPATPSLSIELQATSLAEELANLQVNSPAQVLLPGQVPES
uniref:C3H1-type domain-containing protein n=2 Tax=Bursaphelenchus xylophilus TaxID=6326 RepID=A0A1I7RY43_BURXY